MPRVLEKVSVVIQWHRSISHEPHAEQICDADIRQDDQPTSTDSLYDSPSKQHFRVDAHSAYQRPNKKDDVRNEHDRLTAKYVTELAPDWRRSWAPVS